MVRKSEWPEMPFGKHKGKRLNKVPKGYLRWVRENCSLQGYLADAVECILRGEPAPKRPVNPLDVIDLVITPHEEQEKAPELFPRGPVRKVFPDY